EPRRWATRLRSPESFPGAFKPRLEAELAPLLGAEILDDGHRLEQRRALRVGRGAVVLRTARRRAPAALRAALGPHVRLRRVVALGPDVERPLRAIRQAVSALHADLWEAELCADLVA